MPYKLSRNGLSVMVKRKGKWIVLKTYKAHKEALAYFRALKLNVKH